MSKALAFIRRVGHTQLDASSIGAVPLHDAPPAISPLDADWRCAPAWLCS
jgi:hypothetical protein